MCVYTYIYIYIYTYGCIYIYIYITYIGQPPAAQPSPRASSPWRVGSGAARIPGA